MVDLKFIPRWISFLCVRWCDLPYDRQLIDQMQLVLVCVYFLLHELNVQVLSFVLLNYIVSFVILGCVL